MLLFGRMYEDVAIEREAFLPGSRVFSIASSGCTAMALAPDHEGWSADQRELLFNAISQAIPECHHEAAQPSLPEPLEPDRKLGARLMQIIPGPPK